MEVSRVFANVQATPVEVKSLNDLAALAVKNTYSLSTFEKNKRNIENFKQAEAIGLDFDSGMTLVEAKKAFAKYKHVILPTKSHQKEKNGVTCDRFRVILFLSTPITDRETYAATWQSLKDQFPACDEACKDPARQFFASIGVASIKNDGELVAPIAPQAKPKLEVVPPTPQGARGELSRDTLRLLEFGVKSNRNASVVKAAFDFNRSLYTQAEAEARIMASLHRNGVIAKDFTEAEALKCIANGYKTKPETPPTIEQKAFSFMSVGDMLSLKVKHDWVIDRLIPVGGLVLIAGPPKAGKSTLVRQAVRSIARGENFLGHSCKKGGILYLALEEQVELMQADFKRLGITSEDNIKIHFGTPGSDAAIEQLKDVANEMKPTLIVVDTLFLLSPVKDVGDYGQVNLAMTKIRKIARESGAAVLCVHHTRKPSDNGSPADGILGSTAIRGAVDASLILEARGRERLLSTEGRGVNWYLRRILVYDEHTQTYTLGPCSEEEF